MKQDRFWKNGVLVREIRNGQEITENLGKKIGELRTKLPSKLAMARNAVASVGAAIKNPKRVSDEEKARRLAICEGCEFLIRGKSDRCAKCGCFLKWKTALESWHCPIKKW